jgi:hypothetical protein
MLLCPSRAKVQVSVEVLRTSELDFRFTTQDYCVLIHSRLNPSSPLAKSVSLGASDTLKLLLTTVDGKTAKRPHQAFLTLTDPTTGLEESYVLNVKESGKGKVDLVRCHSNGRRTKLTIVVPKRPSPPVPYFIKANRRLDRDRLFWVLHALQEQSL